MFNPSSLVRRAARGDDRGDNDDASLTKVCAESTPWPENASWYEDSWCELSRLKQVILDNMPITEHLQFSLFRDAAERLVATAPLEPNANHRQTAFGGSLSMLATVAGWAMTRLVLRERDYADASVVIQKSSIDYCGPVCGDLVMQCAWPPEEKRASFFDTLDRWGKARLPLRCTTAAADGQETVVFDGSYVALLR
ncbi:MAG: thioesterase [Bacteroidetes bacterium SW_4_67_19]|jgi:thioesterase domain-containing protein|nr:MAG: thioesterase [Bacteroidetes bacterium SW_4_67_19]